MKQVNGRWIAVLSLSIAAWAGVAAAQGQGGAQGKGDPARGQVVFEDHCSSCHALKDNLQGPHLGGVVGRKAGSVADADYTDAMKAAGLVWTADKLDAFLTGPSKLVPGTAMSATVSDAAERRDLIAYLASASASGK
jgi:cytochrome c2